MVPPCPLSAGGEAAFSFTAGVRSSVATRTIVVRGSCAVVCDPDVGRGERERARKGIIQKDTETRIMRDEVQIVGEKLGTNFRRRESSGR